MSGEVPGTDTAETDAALAVVAFGVFPAASASDDRVTTGAAATI